MPQQINTKNELDCCLSPSDTQLIVIDFYATWCGPCKMIAPQIEQLSKEYPNVKFFKIDVDQFEEAATQFNITAMPTFIFLKGGKKIAEVVGANINNIKATVECHK